MKITKEQLRQIIKEQLEEGAPNAPLTNKQMADILEASNIAMGVTYKFKKLANGLEYLHSHEVKKEIRIIREYLSQIERLTREI